MVENSSKKPKYLIQILVDQASPKWFFYWIDLGIAPNISKYILGEKTKDNTYSKATISRNIVTGYPSTSANTHVSIITGSYARKNNLTYTIFWDLLGKVPKFVNVERASLKALKEINSFRINPLCKTLFEHTKDSASFHMIHRGARVKMFTLKTILFKFLPLLVKVKRLMKEGDEGPFENPEFWRAFLRKNISSFLKKAQKQKKFPLATFIVHLLTDESAHRAGFNSEKYKQALMVLDYIIECLVEGIDIKKEKKEEITHFQGLKELGLLENIIWNFCTDHAGREVFRDKFVFINSLARVDLGLNLIDGEDKEYEVYIKSLKGNLSKINAFTITSRELWHSWFRIQQIEKLKDYTRFQNENYFRNLTPKLHQTKNIPIQTKWIS